MEAAQHTRPAAFGISSPDALVDALKEAHGSRERYAEILESVEFGLDELASMCLFERDFYTRNLIERTDAFELLALCWPPGVTSPIHDHGGSDGWVRVIQGACEEVVYQCYPRAEGPPRIAQGRSTHAVAGATSYINDDLGWHTVGNPTELPAFSLHLYAPPIDHCQYIDPETGLARTKAMTYYSRRGVLA